MNQQEPTEDIVDAHFAPAPTRPTWIEGAVWCVVTGVLLVSGMVKHDTWYGEIDGQSLLILTLYALAQATGVVGIFYLLRTSLREVGEPFQPGHWLLILIGVSAPFYVLGNVTQVVLFYDGFADTESYMRANTIGIIFWHIIEWGLVLMLAFTLPVRGAWRLLVIIYFCGAMLVVAELVAVHFHLHANAEAWYGYLSTRYFVLSAFLLLGFAVWDAVTTTDRRDWLHWVGIANELVFFTPSFITLYLLLNATENTA